MWRNVDSGTKVYLQKNIENRKILALMDGWTDMPIVDIKILEGRSAEMKRRLISEVTDSVEHSLGVRRDAIRVIIQEIPPAHWGVAGEPKELPELAADVSQGGATCE